MTLPKQVYLLVKPQLDVLNCFTASGRFLEEPVARFGFVMYSTSDPVI